MNNVHVINTACVDPGCPVCAVKTQPLTITDDLIQRAKDIASTKPVRAAGYRIKVFLLESDKGLEGSDKDAFPTLAKAGVVTKSDNQKKREDKGTDMALVVDIGPAAFNSELAGRVPWVKVGQVIRMMRYTGHTYEEPPGSGRRYALINDEDPLGVYDETVQENS